MTHGAIFPVAVFLTASLALYPCFAEQVAVERVAREPAIGRAIAGGEAPSENKWYAGTFFDYGDVVQGSRLGKWTEMTSWFGRTYKGIRGYVSFSKLERFEEKDYTGNLGAYVKLKDYYIHEEVGFGSDVDFIYKFQHIAEVSHKLYKNLSWQLGYTFRQYPVNNTHLIYPGLTYYFGDHYLSADYGISHIESRGTGQFGTAKMSFAINKHLRWTTGASVGQWLYDIYGLSTEKEYGYIGFTTFNVEIRPGVHLNTGFSYGEENPKFIKRSYTVSLSADF